MNIALKDIEKSYDRPVLKKISYTFESGKIYVIKGVSGCGKSTLLNIMGGIEKNYKGSICVDGQEYKCDMLRPMTGYVYQYSLLLSNISVLENLLLIKNDIKLIGRLSEEMGVSDILQKYPDQISGGERQRISIIRALLQNPKILLMDEPTASLDEDNANRIADIINYLKSMDMSLDRIIIVATHEHYFDESADEVINLSYGEIGDVVKNGGTADRNAPEAMRVMTTSRTADMAYCPSTSPTKNISAFTYNLKRNKKLLSFFNLLPFAIMFLLIMAVSTLQNSFENEYMRLIKKDYPVDAFAIAEKKLQAFEYKEKVKIYDFYRVREHNADIDADIDAYYLADKKDSVFSIKGMIEEGEFPKNDDEILVSREFIETVYENTGDLKKYIGEKITFKGVSFTVSGILFSLDKTKRSPAANENFESYFDSDIYYRRQKGNLIFIPYEKIKTMGEPGETEHKMASYRDLFDDMKVVAKLREVDMNGRINMFDSEIINAQYMVDRISSILLFIFGVCFIISCIFMSSRIQIELFYRRKELGFLQIFGLKKKRIMELICAGYLIKVLASFVCAVVSYAVIVLIYSAVSGHMVFLNTAHVLAVLTAMTVFYFVSVYLSANKFLKKSIIKLVTDTR